MKILKLKKLNKILIIFILIIMLIFFLINKSKKNIIGNNKNSQDVINNILNIRSYEAVIDLEINSNKNNNKYVLRQKYKYPNQYEQEIIEPEDIKGIKIIANENEVNLENPKLEINKTYKNSKNENNYINLYTFIEKYKKSENIKNKEIDNQIILSIEENNKYYKYLSLYIDKNTGKPIKMEIKSDNKKTLIYILYKEVKLN